MCVGRQQQRARLLAPAVSLGTIDDMVAELRQALHDEYTALLRHSEVGVVKFLLLALSLSLLSLFEPTCIYDTAVVSQSESVFIHSRVTVAQRVCVSVSACVAV